MVLPDLRPLSSTVTTPKVLTPSAKHLVAIPGQPEGGRKCPAYQLPHFSGRTQPTMWRRVSSPRNYRSPIIATGRLTRYAKSTMYRSTVYPTITAPPIPQIINPIPQTLECFGIDLAAAVHTPTMITSKCRINGISIAHVIKYGSHAASSPDNAAVFSICNLARGHQYQVAIHCHRTIAPQAMKAARHAFIHTQPRRVSSISTLWLIATLTSRSGRDALRSERSDRLPSLYRLDEAYLRLEYRSLYVDKRSIVYGSLHCFYCEYL